jgi:hypothetical protein
MESEINYSLIFKFAEAKRILKSDKKFILDSIYHFSDFFSVKAKVKGTLEKRFDLSDIRVLSYVSLYWEEEPDFENIIYGLNSNGHYEDNINEFIDGITPIFLEPNDFNVAIIGESILINSLADYSDKILLAKSYKRSADELIKLAIDSNERADFLCPVIFCYRHSIELFIKSIIIGKEIRSHNLKKLYTIFEKLISEKFNQQVPDWFKNTILAINDFDPESTTFRYGEKIETEEYLLDLNSLKIKMNLIEKSFINIHVSLH